MSKQEGEYTNRKARTIQTLAQAATKTKAKMGSLFKPLLDILHQTVIDELHLFQQIFDVLRNLIYMTLKLDQEQSTNTHTAALKKAIAECGVSFSLYEKKDGTQHTTGHL